MVYDYLLPITIGWRIKWGKGIFPLCVKSKDVDTIVDTIALISGSFGGVNLEDIGAPRCFEIERKLKEKTDIPIFHDDQHGTAVVCLAAVINALKLVGKRLEDSTITFSGAGAAGGVRRSDSRRDGGSCGS